MEFRKKFNDLSCNELDVGEIFQAAKTQSVGTLPVKQGVKRVTSQPLLILVNNCTSIYFK